MYYIEQIDDEYVKYEVSLDEEKLKELRDEIIRNCGEIIHYCYLSPSRLESIVRQNNELKYIENFRTKYVRYSNKHGEIYVYSYDAYDNTRLSELIDSLLGGDSSVISEIKNPVFKRMRKTLKLRNPKKRLNVLLSKEELSEKEMCKLEELKQKLKFYNKYQKLNKERKSDIEYYPLVLTCINMIEIERISVAKIIEWQTLVQQTNNTLEELKPFFIGTNQEDILSLGLKKEL